MIASLPPGGYPDLATKQDIEDLRKELRESFLGVGSDLKRFLLVTILTANLALAAALAGIAFGAGLGAL